MAGARTRRAARAMRKEFMMGVLWGEEGLVQLGIKSLRERSSRRSFGIDSRDGLAKMGLNFLAGV
jgi:hypothetical protein